MTHLTAAKMGRPTTDPKPHKVGARINDEDFKILLDYCTRHQKTQPEAIRDGIKSLKEK
ncbi:MULTISPECIES: hypothetical protein [Anaerotruncus]|uniref:hypothetical protein n=1 Tax=Anaerotruncus TaxID=244127 RepID=UPI001558027B|nr:hypothetical protein [Anaerotruncus massiliensis (ex Togo et al. 2019)]